MRVTGVNHVVLLVLAVVGIASRAYASGAIIVVPPGLSPGEAYRLVFVTSGTTNAISNTIANYNTFVTNQADAVPALAALGATWTVIGSTESVGAATNIGLSSAGIYGLNGLEVAAGTTALFATLSTALLSPISMTQDGVLLPNPTWVWSGSYPQGAPLVGNALGDSWPGIGLALPMARK